MSSQIHIINKADIKDNKVLPYDAPSMALPQGAVKARSKLLSITLTNQAYAQLGTVLNWWDAFPVPEDLPAPYNNRDEWGIVASWGYGEILESNNKDISAGTLMYGYWPTGTYPVIFNFKGSSVGGHFIEVSPHRQKLMNLYNHFTTVPDKELSEKLAWNSAVMTLWSAGYFLATYSFPSKGKTAISPNGETPWTQEDGELEDSLVVLLVASGKTARGVSWGITQRSSRDSNPPKAFLEVCSAPAKLATSVTSKITTKAVGYDGIASDGTLQWINTFNPKRIVLVDFGAPPGTAQNFHDAALKQVTTLEKFDHVFAVPSEIKTSDPRTVQHLFNTSPLVDAAIKAEGLDSVYSSRVPAFKEWFNRKGMGDMDLQWGEGIRGDGGIEGAWEALVNGNLPRRKALVFQV